MARQQRRPAAAPTPPPPAARASLLLRLHRPASHRPGRKMGGRGVRQGSQASAGERGRQGPVQRRGSSRGQGSSSPHSAACMVWYGAGVVAPAATPQPHCIPALYLVQVCRGNEFTPRVGVAPPCKAPPPASPPGRAAASLRPVEPQPPSPPRNRHRHCSSSSTAPCISGKRRR